MANVSEKVKDNVPGKFYVDESCILCMACIQISPEHFESNNQFAFVKKQPENEEENKICEEALEACPVDAIGDDGGKTN